MGNKLSILIPVYNEWQTVGRLIRKLIELELEKEIIVVDDGSTDATQEMLASLSNPDLHVIRHPVNLGKGAAVRTGLARCSGDIVVIQDADLDQELSVIYRLVQPIISDGAEMVYGSRFLGERPKMKWANYLANIFLSALTRFLYRARVTDVETCFKVFRTDVLKSIPLTAKGFEFEVEVTAKALKRGFLVKEVLIREDWYQENYHQSKKLNWLDGAKAVFTLLKYRFVD